MTSADAHRVLMEIDGFNPDFKLQDYARMELEKTAELSQRRVLTEEFLIQVLKSALENTSAARLPIAQWAPNKYLQVESTLIFGKASGRYEVSLVREKKSHTLCVVWKFSPDVIR